jgi:anaerobic selenocysteine-containing dehydrogenase
MERLSRRSFVKIAGAATGAAALAAAPPIARAAVGEEEAQPTHPTARVPEEPLVAYVRDARRGEVTVTSGLTEHTYHDRALVKRILRAAGRKGVS